MYKWHWTCNKPRDTVCEGYAMYALNIIIIFKIRKLKSVRGGRSTIAVEVIAVETIAVETIAVDPGEGGQLTIAVEAIAVDPGGSINDCC